MNDSRPPGLNYVVFYEKNKKYPTWFKDGYIFPEYLK